MKIPDISVWIKRFIKFITVDIWRALPQDLSTKKRRGYLLLKIITLALRRYQSDRLQRSASALTYSTFLSVIPMLAVLLAIAKGFGFSYLIESRLMSYFPGKSATFQQVLELVDSYMQHTSDGVFLGLGLLMLLYTVYSLISNIENTFNMIWQVSKGRSAMRRLTDYFSAFLLIPVFLVCSSGLSILMATTLHTLEGYQLIAPLYEVLITFGPWIISILGFTALYLFMPNTKVQFKHALYAGIFAAIGFQVFQYLYIHGQIWVSKYNAIYGSFAVIPLMLLWMQLSWVICLMGAEIAYAGQNVQNYDFEADSKNISRRYLDFTTLTILSLIFKRFASGKKPYTDVEIATHYKIPVRLTKTILFQLMESGFINELKEADTYPHYQPAVDINLVSVQSLFDKIDQSGSEDFKIDHKHQFHKEWEVILQSRIDMFAKNKNLLVKDL